MPSLKSPSLPPSVTSTATATLPGARARRPHAPLRKRAISDDHKQQRRQAILDAALAMLDSTPYEAITMQSLAQRLGLVKGTLYLYFTTKESLFLAVQIEQLAAWFADLDAVLADGPQLSPQALARVVSESLARHPQLPRLLTILHSVLERNISLEDATEFKRFARARVHATGALIEAALPSLPRGQGVVVILRLHALVIGTWLMTDHSAVVRAAIGTPGAELEMFDLAFAPLLESTLAAIVTGMVHGAR